MHISKRQLKQIIKEEVRAVLQEGPGITFYQMIDMAKPGDKLKLNFKRNVTTCAGAEVFGKCAGATVVAFKKGKTYNGTIKTRNVIIFHEKIMGKGKSDLTKSELKAKIRKAGGACKTMNCNTSTVTRGNNPPAPISAIMANPALMEPKPTPAPEPTPTPEPTPEPSVGCKSDAECKSKCGNIPSCKCINGNCINTGGVKPPPGVETEVTSLPEDIVLRYGSGYRSRGKAAQKPDVKKLQNKLVKLNHISPTRTNRRGKTVSSVDGFYGPQTKKAVQDFQRKNKLPPNGVAAGETLKALNASERRRPLNLPPGR